MFLKVTNTFATNVSVESLSKQMQDIKNQVQTLELKNTLTEIQDLLGC